MRPVLLLDIDGVLCPLGLDDCPDGFTAHLTPSTPDDGTQVRRWFASHHGDWIKELAAAFQVVWASAWGNQANSPATSALGIDALEHVPFPPIPFDPREKVPAIAAYVGDRPAAWIDDLLTHEAQQWARDRAAPTLLVAVDASVGICREHVDHLLAWAAEIDAGG